MIVAPFSDTDIGGALTARESSLNSMNGIQESSISELSRRHITSSIMRYTMSAVGEERIC